MSTQTASAMQISRCERASARHLVLVETVILPAAAEVERGPRLPELAKPLCVGEELQAQLESPAPNCLNLITSTA